MHDCRHLAAAPSLHTCNSTPQACSNMWIMVQLCACVSLHGFNSSLNGRAATPCLKLWLLQGPWWFRFCGCRWWGSPRQT